MTNIGGDLDVFGLNLGGNVFGWTAGEAQSFAVLDAYLEAGGNFLDTADVYSAWVPGNSGGESEAIIGRWAADRGVRDRIVIATKVGQHPEHRGLAAPTVRAAVDASLARLQTDRIDLLYAHIDDDAVPLAETLGAFDELVKAGKVRHIAASNYSAGRLAEALRVSDEHGLVRYVALQPHFNLLERDAYEGALAELAQREGLAVLPYFGLARGFLTGKYRRGGAAVDSPRAGSAAAFLEDDDAVAKLAVLDELADAHDVPVAAVALAWLRAQPGIVAPIASARTVEQLREILPSATLELGADELARLA